jgi:hypothetical protein
MAHREKTILRLIVLLAYRRRLVGAPSELRGAENDGRAGGNTPARPDPTLGHGKGLPG